MTAAKVRHSTRVVLVINAKTDRVEGGIARCRCGWSGPEHRSDDFEVRCEADEQAHRPTKANR